MGDPILIKELGHLRRDHISIVWYRDERDFFARFWGRLRSGGLVVWLFLMWRVIHGNQQYTPK